MTRWNIKARVIAITLVDLKKNNMAIRTSTNTVA
jgi:hypothetical protein